jgi:hypothetical protein
MVAFRIWFEVSGFRRAPEVVPDIPKFLRPVLKPSYSQSRLPRFGLPRVLTSLEQSAGPAGDVPEKFWRTTAVLISL